MRIFILLCFLAFDARAAEGTLIKAGGEAHARVQNDMLDIVLSLDREGQDPARLVRETEMDAGRALEKAKHASSVKVQTLGYSISPVFDRQRITGQRANYRLMLETRDFDAGFSLASSLQPFQISSVNFSVSSERSRAVRKKLLEGAIADLKEKFDIMAHSIGASKMEIREISIDRAAQPIALSLASIPAAAGESEISVSLSGTALVK